MKISILILFILFLNIWATAQKCSCDSLCFCEILIKDLKQNWNKWVQNSDSIRLIAVKEIGEIETESNKTKYVGLLTADTAWVAHPAYGKSVFVEFLKYDSAQGNNIKHYNSSRTLISSYTVFPKKDNAIISLNRNIKLTDKYYEIYFQINGKIIMSPTICSKTNKYLCTGFVDNIISHLSITRQ